MAKKQQAPAFLFYTDNFMGGTLLFTNEQVGKYIRLLCAQHKIGRLSKEYMLQVCNGEDKLIFEKFVMDSEGLYYNPRLELEVNKRIEFVASRTKNLKGEEKSTSSTSGLNGNSKQNDNKVPMAGGCRLDVDKFRSELPHESKAEWGKQLEIWRTAKGIYERERGNE